MTKYELRKITAELLEMDTEYFTDDMLLEDIGLDSIRLIQLIVEIEERYDIEIYDSDLSIGNFKTLNVMYRTLCKYFESMDHESQNVPLIKCVITDCDGVLWRGIAGESGADVAYIDSISTFYGEILVNFKKRGGLLALVSRNEKKNLLDMFKRDEVPLDVEDFVILETECENKESAIARVLSETGFSEEHMLYIDDSRFELTVVSDHFPEIHVLTAEMTNDFLHKLCEYLESTADTEVVDRTKQFREQKAREVVHGHVRSVDEYNSILETVTKCRKAVESDAERIAELSQRTNRFNVSGFRYTEEEVQKLIQQGIFYVLTVSDRFGDMGLVGAIAVRGDVIENFMLSCRVFGRNFEQLLLDIAVSDCVGKLRGIWNDNGKNKYCKEFYTFNGIEILSADREDVWNGIV